MSFSVLEVEWFSPGAGIYPFPLEVELDYRMMGWPTYWSRKKHFESGFHTKKFWKPIRIDMVVVVWWPWCTLTAIKSSSDNFTELSQLIQLVPGVTNLWNIMPSLKRTAGVCCFWRLVIDSYHCLLSNLYVLDQYPEVRYSGGRASDGFLCRHWLSSLFDNLTPILNLVQNLYLPTLSTFTEVKNNFRLIIWWTD